MQVCVDFFSKLNLLPLYSLYSQGENVIIFWIKEWHSFIVPYCCPENSFLNWKSSSYLTRQIEARKFYFFIDCNLPFMWRKVWLIGAVLTHYKRVNDCVNFQIITQSNSNQILFHMEICSRHVTWFSSCYKSPTFVSSTSHP